MINKGEIIVLISAILMLFSCKSQKNKTSENSFIASGLQWKGVALQDARVAYDRLPVYNPEFDPDKVTKICGADPKLERPKIIMINDQPLICMLPEDGIFMEETEQFAMF